MKTGGRLTIPTQLDLVDKTLDLIQELDADAIRDCDGTQMPEALKDCGAKIYATYYTTRKDNEWARNNPEEVQQEYLTTDRITAMGDVLVIELMKGFHTEQLKINEHDDMKRWWEVMDRTTGEPVSVDLWSYSEGKVTLKSIPYHVYTVSFLAYLIWDPVHMFNFLTNDWKGAEHQCTFDVRQPKTQAYVKEKLHRFLKDHPEVDVIRFTTFFHQFTLTFDDKKREKFVEWFGYSASVSPYILEQFEKWAGYPFRAEYIVDQGCFNSIFREPSKQFLDFIEFQQIEVCRLAKELVDIVHSYGKEAMMFLGDHWIGTEPYGKYFSTIGLDAVVGSVGSGVTLRMISDIEGVKYTEGRLLPYFFPDVFHEGGDPIGEAQTNWLQARRAILRSPLDRIGYGGYLSYALQWPGFIETIKNVVSQFRMIHDRTGDTPAYTAPFKVAILNSWGHIRKWMNNQVHHSIYHREIYSYVGVIECLSGMPVDVEFINFDDVKNGLDPAIKVLINAGDRDTSWSGNDHWKDPLVLDAIRRFVANGGGFIGIGEPTACMWQGSFFQLRDVLGVDEELGFTLSTDKYNTCVPEHFILQERTQKLDFGEGKNGIYAYGDQVQVLHQDGEYTQLAVNSFGHGRAVYMAGLPYSPENCRLLLRSLYWAAGEEALLKEYYVSDPRTEIAAYEQPGLLCVINNCMDEVRTDVYVHGQFFRTLVLSSGAMEWLDLKEGQNGSGQSETH